MEMLDFRGCVGALEIKAANGLMSLSPLIRNPSVPETQLVKNILAVICSAWIG